MSSRQRFRRFLLNASVSLAATVITLLLLDLVLILTGLFPPRYDYGDAKVGWLSAAPTGRIEEEGCLHLASNSRLTFIRNEDGIRTDRPAAELQRRDGRLHVGVSGDSHTDLCAPNARTHVGVLEHELTTAGTPTSTFGAGAGKYSPLQAYLAVQASLRAYHAEALVLNVYTGNDFYDMLRVDDRPHLEWNGMRYAVAPPVWYQQDEPGVVHRSRVRYAARLIAQASGVRRVWLRVTYLRDVAASQGQGLGAVLAYMNDLRKARADGVGYPEAFAAQMLNQQLFFHRFPESRAESIRRLQALLALIRSEQPDLLLVLSALPSYQLVDRTGGDGSLKAVMANLPISFEAGVRQEESLYEDLRRLAVAEGWVFVDNLRPLRTYSGAEPLFNTFDYHLEPAASEIVGRTQAAAVIAARKPSLGRVGGTR